VFHCPSDDITDSRGRWDNPEFGGFTAAQLPDKFDADDVPGSYRINLSDLPRYQYDAIKITQIRKPTMSIFLLEGGPKAPARLPQDGPLHHVATWELGSAPEARVGRLLRTNVAWDRHGGRNNKVSNYAFADGHAETLQYEATWVPIGPQVWQGSTNFYHQATMWRQRYEVNPDLGPPARPTPQSVQP
jgi:prepilin-type processing-associated H-X9-DG protein